MSNTRHNTKKVAVGWRLQIQHKVDPYQNWVTTGTVFKTQEEAIAKKDEIGDHPRFLVRVVANRSDFK